MTDMIKTERLLLRPIRMEDADDIVAGVGDLDVSRWLTHPPHPYSREDAVEFISLNLGRFPQVVVIEFEEAFAGLSGIGKELGYWLAKPAWGKGIALEASEALIAHVFDSTDVDSIQSGYLLGNNRSRKILEILGFSNMRLEDVIPRSTGQETKVQKMSLSRARWEATR